MIIAIISSKDAIPHPFISSYISAASLALPGEGNHFPQKLFLRSVKGHWCLGGQPSEVQKPWRRRDRCMLGSNRQESREEGILILWGDLRKMCLVWVELMRSPSSWQSNLRQPPGLCAVLNNLLLHSPNPVYLG